MTHKAINILLNQWLQTMSHKAINRPDKHWNRGMFVQLGDPKNRSEEDEQDEEGMTWLTSERDINWVR